MLGKFEDSKLNEIMEIWLETNIQAHSFINKKYWLGNYNFVKEILPEADVITFEEAGEILGFAGISDESYIAGIFVRKEHQSKGIGANLLNECKRRYTMLHLKVYEKNIKAIGFYEANGFKKEEKSTDEENNEIEIKMTWRKDSL